MIETDPRAAASMELTTPAATAAFPPLPVAGGGQVCLGGQAPMVLAVEIADAGAVALGGQAPMFLPHAIADAGLVRLGGQSPAF